MSIQSSLLTYSQALRLADPTEMGYVLRWPFHGGNFNTRDYPSNEILLTDVEDLIKTTLHERLNIPPNTLTVRALHRITYA